MTFAVSLVIGHAQAADPTLKLSKKQDTFFIEDDFVYRRFLQLARDGTYCQINRERTTGAEVDRGTWEQSADGTLFLHFTRGGLRFHALLSGPLAPACDHGERPSKNRRFANGGQRDPPLAGSVA